MGLSRRQFLQYCGAAASALGLTRPELGLLRRALASPNAPAVVWLQGSGCFGCSISFLNRISTTPPLTAADVLIDIVNLTYHPALMGAAGEDAARLAQATCDQGNFILVVEGGVPTAHGGHTCGGWTIGTEEVTFEKVVRQFAARAKTVMCVGTCACWGGVSAAPPNPTGVVGVQELTKRETINVSGCPPHPDWIVSTLARILAGETIDLDGFGRPTRLYEKTVHYFCPRKKEKSADTFGLHGLCLKKLGCRGRVVGASCPVALFNGGRNWCVKANAPCIGCTKKGFPFRKLHRKRSG